MTKLIWAAGAAAAILATIGCSKQPEAGNGAAATPADDTSSRIAAMTEAERDAVFIRAIRDAGFDCQHVDSSASAGPGAWSATCSDHRQWTIAIGQNGNAQVTAVPAQPAAGTAGPGNSG